MDFSDPSNNFGLLVPAFAVFVAGIAALRRSGKKDGNGVAAPPTMAAPAPAVAPIAPALVAAGSDVTDATPAVVVVPPLAPTFVGSWTNALTCMDMIIAVFTRTIVGSFLETTAIVAVPGPTVRIRAITHFNAKTMPPRAMCDYIRHIWDTCRTKGERALASGPPNIVAFRKRIVRLFHNITQNDRRFVGRGEHASRQLDTYPVSGRCHTIARINPTAAKNSDKYHEVFGVRTDTEWFMHLLAMYYRLCTMRGLTEVQARYVAAVNAIDALAVAYGFQPGSGVPGAAPEDLGFTLPVALPRAP